MTVSELITRLVRCQAEAGAPVVVTWEGTLRELTDEDVYATPDGICVINAESGDRKEEHLSRGLRSELDQVRGIEYQLRRDNEDDT